MIPSVALASSCRAFRRYITATPAETANAAYPAKRVITWAWSQYDWSAGTNGWMPLSYTWRYFSGGWFCPITVPRMEVTAGRMMLQIASFIEIMEFQTTVENGLAGVRSALAETGTFSVRTSETVSIGTPPVGKT